MVLALCIGAGSLLYTNQLANRLANQERNKVELWANGTKFLATSEDPNADLSFVFEVVKANTTIPLVLTDGDDNIISLRNFDEEKSEDPEYQLEQLRKIKGHNESIEIELYGGTKNFIHYVGHSQVVRRLVLAQLFGGSNPSAPGKRKFPFMLILSFYEK